jgi:ATP diphosphatase
MVHKTVNSTRRSFTLTSAPVTKSAPPVFDRALDLVRFLRARCEWDAKQTPDSLVPYLLEEAHEAAEAVTSGDDDELLGELGDLLLNVAFQAILAEERGSFDAESVVARLEAKMRRRHPHLYGDGPAEDWELLKAREREAKGNDEGGPISLLDGVAGTLEPLSRAQRLQDRVSAVGFDWTSPAGALAKVREELDEVERAEPELVEAEIGDVLFAVVNAARLLGVHGMRALHGANAKFERRFRELERLARARGLDLVAMTLEEMDSLWDEVKGNEASGGSGSDPGSRGGSGNGGSAG